MLPSNTSSIRVSDFEKLIIEKIPEGRNIEYKRELKTVPDKETKEFLADVSSFANDLGGDLIFGIEEQNGAPQKLLGIEIANVDALKRQLDSIIRDGLEPRISNIAIEAFHLSNLQYLLLIRIPKTYMTHQVVFKDSDKFYSRGVAGKYKMDVHELKNRFQASDAIDDKLKKFQHERLQKITDSETPVPLLPHAKIILQFIPLSSLTSDRLYNVSSNGVHPTQLAPLGSNGYEFRDNADGLLCYSLDRNSNGAKAKYYAQIFRNGVIETINAYTLAPYGGELLLPSLRVLDYERQIIECFRSNINLYKVINIEPPIHVYLTFLGIKGYSLQSSRVEWRFHTPPQIDRDVLSFNDLIIKNFRFKAESELKPIFDIIWNACGLEKSRNYDVAGEWIGPK